MATNLRREKGRLKLHLIGLALIVCLLASFSCLTPPPPPSPKIIFSTPELTSTPPEASEASGDLESTSAATSTSSMPSPESTSTQTSTPPASPPTPTPKPAPTSTPSPPLNVTLNYIGVTSAHDQEDIWDPTGEVQLLVVITDGRATSQTFLPPTKQGFKMGDFETKEINQRVFHTDSAGDYLKVSIVAYEIDSKTEALNYLTFFELMGVAGASELKKLYELLPQEDDFIGYYESIWYPGENWGTGQYNAVGVGDLRVWLSVWSNTEPAPVTSPRLVPHVKIQSVSIPNQVKVWYWASHTLTLTNNESCDITVNWKAQSTVTGDFANESATLRRNGSLDIKRQYQYNKTGPATITYTVLYKGTELDSWSGTVNVIP
jgi:hypothetical protein